MSFGSSNSEMASASSFSYAQAAKGQGTPAQTQAANQSTASEMNGTNDAPSATVEEKSSTAQEPSNQTAHAAPSTDTSTTSAERHDNDSVSAVSEAQTTESAPEKRPEAKRDGEVSRLDQPWRQAEKSARSSSAATRSVDEQDSRRQRKGRKGKPSEKQAGDATPSSEQSKDEPEAPKIELSEAPIPTVNIWQQRKAAQVKPKSETPATASSALIDQNAGPKPAANNNSNTKPTSSDVNGVKPAPRPAEKSERNGSRGNRVPIRETRDPKAGVPPSVADAVSWPTPETATSEEPKKAAEKAADKEVKDESAPKPRQKNEWVKYDYVPTVAFETQLPQMRSSKPRGGAKGTGSSRSSTAAQGGEKATATTPTKSTETRDRTREAGSAGGRNTSQPPASKRASTEGAPARGEQRKPAHNTAGDRVKDVASSQQTEQQPVAREPRSERGRGGYRGRGGHHSVNGHSQHQSTSNAAGASFSNGNMGGRTSGPYSPPRNGHGQGQMYMPSTSRGGRGARGGNNYHRMSLPNGGTRLPPVQTHYAPYDYQMPLSAVAYPQTPYMDPVLAGVMMRQIEYYFSVENLCKDVFLRRHMDGQGYVPLLFITAFKRMREIGLDISIVRAVCEASEVIDYIIEPDGTERLRRRDGWQIWVLPTQERDELARTDGPAKVTYKSRAYQYPQQGQFNGMQSPYGMGSQQEYHQHFADAHNYNMANGMPNGNGAATQLSAEVPDFAPAQAAGLPNGHVSAAAVNGVDHDDNAQAAGLS